MKNILVPSLILVSGLLAQAPARKTAVKKAAPAAPPPSWRLWAGPNRDFKSDSTGLAGTWPAAGPKRLWSRPLGDGYSAIAVDNDVLYTMYSRGSQDVVIALDARTGKTVWEHAYDAPFRNEYVEAGPGPFAMPQIIGDRVFTVGGTGKIHALDRKTGKALWQHDLYREYQGTVLRFGYSCHALPYKNTLIFMSGGRNSALIAFNQHDGAVVY
ncbi:MAG: PQQ-binding-like beta-propeller repeat protein, partial [Bryobacteraceae bacterium]